jgi:hypothetical protein
MRGNTCGIFWGSEVGGNFSGQPQKKCTFWQDLCEAGRSCHLGRTKICGRGYKKREQEFCCKRPMTSAILS